jgi:hypothetical protein
MSSRRTVFALAWVGVMLWLASGAFAEDFLQALPPGVFLQKRVEVSAEQREAIGRKLGGGVVGLTNAFLQVQGREIQANVVVADSDASAKVVYESLSKMKGAPFCVRKDRMVVEYVGKGLDAALATKTSYELKLVPKPERVRYRLSMELATIDRADYAACNSLFNLFLGLRGGTAEPQRVAEITALAGRFQFGKTLVLRNPKLSETAATYQFEPMPSRVAEAGDVVRHVFAEVPARHGVSYVKSTLEVSTNGAGLTRSAARPDAKMLGATSYWPASDAKIVGLAEQITRGKTTNEDKVSAILAWLSPGRNVRYSGDPGSRWGTLKVIEQRFGRCWDFSDCFVTLCRAAGVPSRQVAGWLYGTSGHVWAEYYRENVGWQQVDPTGGGELPCGIYHIAYFTSEDGEMPVVYLSMPEIVIGDAR